MTYSDKQYYKDNSDTIKARAKAWHEKNRDRHLASMSAYQKLTNKTPRGRYRQQKNNAYRRGIEWLFTFETWIKWWGDDFYKRGNKPGNLCMSRFGDKGPYSPDNTFKSQGNRNSREGSLKRWTRNV